MTNAQDIEQKPLSVSAAMGLAKSALEQITITLIGEVSEVSNKAGYKAVYFSVKDEKSTMPCMMWMNKFKAAGLDLRVGALVQMTGRFTLWAPKGRMNFEVYSLSLAGEGNLRQQVAMRAKRLKEEGLMDASRKRPLPEMPHTIGLVTSPRGAAVHDVLRTLRRRWPSAAVLLAGVAVEGEGAPAALIEGLATVAEAGAQVILLVRGGGSFEDLMPFNDEELARSIAFSPVPVITGIGHEPDTSIADMVADVRASTPTAAAEAVSPDINELRTALASSSSRLHTSFTSKLSYYETHIEAISNRPVFSDPHQLFATEAQTLDYSEERLHRAIPTGLNRDTQKLALLQQRLSHILPDTLGHTTTRLHALHKRLHVCSSTLLEMFESDFVLHASRLEDLSPLGVLSRGFSITKDESGNLVTSYKQVSTGSRLFVTLADGEIDCEVCDTRIGSLAQIDWKGSEHDRTT